MQALHVHQATFVELDALVGLFDLYRQCQGLATDLPGARAFLRARFDHGESVVFMAQRGAEAIGFAQLYPSWSSTSMARVFVLNDLYVHDSGRRMGAARQLLAAVEGYAWSHGAARLTLNVMRDNAAGRALYAACGWVHDAQHHMFHRFAPAAP